MTAIRLALTELRRVTAGRLPRAALIALVLVPTLYGGLYLYANKDPYGGLERVPAAVVVEARAGDAFGQGLAERRKIEALVLEPHHDHPRHRQIVEGKRAAEPGFEQARGLVF